MKTKHKTKSLLGIRYLCELNCVLIHWERIYISVSVNVNCIVIHLVGRLTQDGGNTRGVPERRSLVLEDCGLRRTSSERCCCRRVPSLVSDSPGRTRC